MKRFLKKNCIASIGLLLFASCAELTLSETEFDCPARKYSFGFDITTDKSWTAEVSDSSWIIISQEAGNGSSYMGVTVLENSNFYTDRHGSVTIKTTNNFYVVEINQAGPKLPVFSDGDTIYSDGDTIFLSCEAQNKTLTVQSDLPVFIKEVEDSRIYYQLYNDFSSKYEDAWLEVSAGENTEEGRKIFITVDENGKYPDDVDRVFSIHVSRLHAPRVAFFILEVGNSHFKFQIKQNSRQFNKESGDLGLSVEWATCDVGANNSSEYGESYTQLELQSKLQDLEKDGWRLPTLQDWRELDNCEKYEIGDTKNRQLVFIAKNGNSIKFKKNSYWIKPTQADMQNIHSYNNSHNTEWGYECLFFWVSPPWFDNDHIYFAHFSCDDKSSIRLVRDKK